MATAASRNGHHAGARRRAVGRRWARLSVEFGVRLQNIGALPVLHPAAGRWRCGHPRSPRRACSATRWPRHADCNAPMLAGQRLACALGRSVLAGGGRRHRRQPGGLSFPRALLAAAVIGFLIPHMGHLAWKSVRELIDTGLPEKSHRLRQPIPGPGGDRPARMRPADGRPRAVRCATSGDPGSVRSPKGIACPDTVVRGCCAPPSNLDVLAHRPRDDWRLQVVAALPLPGARRRSSLPRARRRRLRPEPSCQIHYLGASRWRSSCPRPRRGCAQSSRRWEGEWLARSIPHYRNIRVSSWRLHHNNGIHHLNAPKRCIVPCPAPISGLRPCGTMTLRAENRLARLVLFVSTDRRIDPNAATAQPNNASSHQGENGTPKTSPEDDPENEVPLVDLRFTRYSRQGTPRHLPVSAFRGRALRARPPPSTATIAGRLEGHPGLRHDPDALDPPPFIDPFFEETTLVIWSATSSSRPTARATTATRARSPNARPT